MSNRKYKIVLTGPESTGKSTTSKFLAEEFGGLLLPEFAREYLENLGRSYTYDDVDYIARKQAILEEEYYEKADKLLIVDTSFIILKVWFEFVYGKKPAWLKNAINYYKADLYILTNTEIDWEYDPLREHPGETRELLFELYLKELKNFNLNYKILTGTGKKRLQNAKQILSDFLQTKA